MNLEKILKDKNLKITQSRLLVLNLILTLDTNANIKSILKESNLDKSTVYRIIDLFLEKNIIEKNLSYNGNIYYSIHSSHVHYIKCIKCHKKEQIDICPIDTIKTDGYVVLNHKIEIDGICNQCLINKSTN